MKEIKLKKGDTVFVLPEGKQEKIREYDVVRVNKKTVTLMEYPTNIFVKMRLGEK